MEITLQISRAGRILKLIRVISQRYESHPERYKIRHIYVIRIRRLLTGIDPHTFPKVYAECKSILQKLYADDQRHWSEWDTPWQQGTTVSHAEGLVHLAMNRLYDVEQYVLHATGTERHRLVSELRTLKYAICEAGYITLMPDQFIEYADGERLGYNALRYLLSIFENTDPLADRNPYPTAEENRLFHTANAERVGPEHHEVWADDREYIPPTFTPPLEIGWDNIEKLTRDKAHKIEEAAECALADDKPGMALTLSELFTGSYLSEGERYMALRSIASKAMDMAAQKGQPIGFWTTVDRLSTQAGLDQFVEDNEEELLDRDPGDSGTIMSEQDIMEVADHLIEEMLTAPVVVIPTPILEKMWGENKRSFPAPEKVISWRKSGKVYFRLKDEADYPTLQKLYRLASVELADQKLIHSHTPFYQRGVMNRIAQGMSIPTAYAETRQAYLKHRHGETT